MEVNMQTIIFGVSPICNVFYSEITGKIPAMNEEYMRILIPVVQNRNRFSEMEAS